MSKEPLLSIFYSKAYLIFVTILSQAGINDIFCDARYKLIDFLNNLAIVCT